ncbi:unnamed protein product [Acanthoscelides obtectus]|uniref:DDE Tnp4 domain-containing protein n=1 Tax=Acanthoscelides obtectus TaxID=200917 RepID=A0A9P0P0M0_ACAOB|nr:unnamed protein product [Acanthoscelides obtectus]CAK1634205.1 Putative nuclease HARBI1 [Acanthoscelides obtectus]
MATQNTLLSIGTRFKVSPTTVISITNKVLYFMLKLKSAYIKFPKNEAEMRDISEGFKKYPGVIGAVDGTHIFVKVEKCQQDSYIDRYRRTSINLMAICDSNTLFTYVFLGYPGSAHDSRVFENSCMCKNIERHGPNFYFLDTQKYHLIGDSAFALRTWLITPYQGDNVTRKQKFHNYYLSSDRVKIEHCFGAYKGRWRRVQYTG